MPRLTRTELLLFFACFFAFAYFNQGGGWNQNSRFAEVRAMAEEGRFAIDNFLVYERDPQTEDLARVPVQNAEYLRHGKRFRLAWVDMEWNLYPVGDHPLDPEVEKAPMIERCASGDIAYVPTTGRFHPNKPPGTSFLGLPGYFVIYHVERLLGIDPDHWWTMTLNAWLTTVLSVGFFSAIGCVLFFRLARDFAGGAPVPALLATLTFAFGTTFFPFGTIFFDHNLTAALLIASFYLLRHPASYVGEPDSAGGGAGPRPVSMRLEDGRVFAAGLAAGVAAITNYIAAVAVIFLGLYALLASRAPGERGRWRNAVPFAAGVLGPFLLICWYGWVCFGSPFRLNTDFQNPLFKDPGGMLGMFVVPNPYVAALLVASPFRGLFFFAPVLLLGFYGLFVWLRDKTHVPEARLCLSIFAFFFLVNMSFNGYHAGFSAGPRYLVPGLPFLALPLVVAFARWRKTTLLLALISIVNHLLLTATDGQNPVGVGGHARVEGRRDEWTYNLLGDYAWPLFAHGRAWPLIEGQMAVHMEKEADRVALETDDEAEQAQELDALRKGLREAVSLGEPSPFLLASVEGPVSVNPIGVFEGLFTYAFFPPQSRPCRWASFNLGEFLWPQSRWSLLPLLLVSGGLSILAFRGCRRSPARISGGGAEPQPRDR